MSGSYFSMGRELKNRKMRRRSVYVNPMILALCLWIITGGFFSSVRGDDVEVFDFAAPAASSLDHEDPVMDRSDCPPASPLECPMHAPKVNPNARPFVQGEGESAGGLIRRPVTSCFQTEQLEPESGTFSRLGEARATFGIDEHVRIGNTTTPEINPAMTSNDDADLWLAFEDQYYTPSRITIYFSNDGGENWQFVGYISNATADLKNPSIDMLENNNDYVVVAYIVDDGVSMPYPEVAIAPEYTSSFTFKSVPVWSWEGYAKPVVWASEHYSNHGKIYLTCEGIVDSASENINVCTWMCPYQGEWTDSKVLLGNFDDNAWVDPDADYGTQDRRNYLTCFNKTDSTLYLVRTEENLGDWLPEVAVYTMPEVPYYQVDPEISAANYYNSLVIACTKSFNGNDNIGVTWSSDAGATWTYLYSLDGYTTQHEWAPALCKNDVWDGDWHLAYTSVGACYYSMAPQNISSYFQPVPDRVDDSTTVSGVHPKKAIVSPRWSSPGIAWADFRDGTPDYDIYFDRADDDRRIYVPEEYATIQAAIDSADEHDFIHVNQGTYNENVVIDSILIRLLSVFGPNHTHIDGNRLGSTVTLLNCDHAHIKGFTITNGYASIGGGIHCDGAFGPRIFENVISNNEAYNYGGGLCCINDSSPYVWGNRIIDNLTTGSRGGGLYSSASRPDVENCVIARNSSNGSGGGIYSKDSHVSMEGNTITENTALVSGGGLYIIGPEVPSTTSDIYWDNTAPSDPSIHLESGTPWVNNCDIQGGYAGGEYCIDADPLFVNPANGDYRLSRYSPCINMGRHTGVREDITNQVRPQNGSWDMGAYEFTGPYTLAADGFYIDRDVQTVINLTLDAGTINHDRPYMIFGGATYSAPGVPLPHGDKFLPINFDIITDVVLQLVNTPVFVNFSGTLDAMGTASATIDTLGPLATGSGARLFFAYACPFQSPDGWFASNPVRINLSY